MIDFFKKSAVWAFATISAVFTFVPEAFFGKITWIPDSVLKQCKWIEKNILEVNIIITRVIAFLAIWILASIVYRAYLDIRRKVTINGNNYKIIVEYGDLLKTKKCKRVINFDECFTTQVGEYPADIKPSSICGKYLIANPNLDMKSLITNSHLKPAKSKSKYQNKIRYESGRIVPNGDDLLMAFAKLDEDGLGRLSRDEFLECLSILWKEIDKYYCQKDVCIPILGAGLTRIDGDSGSYISQQELLDMIIWSYKLSSSKIKAPHKLRIICKKCDDFSINKIDSQV